SFGPAIRLRSRWTGWQISCLIQANRRDQLHSRLKRLRRSSRESVRFSFCLDRFCAAFNQLSHTERESKPFLGFPIHRSRRGNEALISYSFLPETQRLIDWSLVTFQGTTLQVASVQLFQQVHIRVFWLVF